MRVYAIERTGMINAAQHIASANGLKRIHFMQGDVHDITLPERVTVVVSEWMGYFALSEGMLSAVLEARDRFLVSGGIMIPHSLDFKAALVHDKSCYEKLSYFRNKPFGFDWSHVADWPFHQTYVMTFDPAQLIGGPIDLCRLELSRCSRTPSRLSATVTVNEATTVFGLCGWFVAHLSDSVALKTGPWDPETHWRQLYFPLKSPIAVRRGEEIRVTIDPIVMLGGRTLWKWTVKTGTDSDTMDDFLGHALLNGS